jgi:hypothetical protein
MPRGAKTENRIDWDAGRRKRVVPIKLCFAREFDVPQAVSRVWPSMLEPKPLRSTAGALGKASAGGTPWAESGNSPWANPLPPRTPPPKPIHIVAVPAEQEQVSRPRLGIATLLTIAIHAALLLVWRVSAAPILAVAGDALPVQCVGLAESSVEALVTSSLSPPTGQSNVSTPVTIAAPDPIETFAELPIPVAEFNALMEPTREPFGLGGISEQELLTRVGSGPDREGLATWRSAGSRQTLVSTRGGSRESEAAVERALEWFVQHQYADGSWSFDHTAGKCNGRCTDPGSMVEARVAATSMALLPFLGAGHTHKQGKYRKNVQLALSYLVHSIQATPDGADLQGGGTLYSQGLATIALCEAYAMTQDRGLARPSQAALNFIATAQDPVGGGWRYAPGMPGDTSVLGWQLMALKSGHLSYLHVPARTIQGVDHFLDSVARQDGAMYGYTTGLDRKDEDRGTTAVGLLCRMYLGWKRDDPALVRGVQLLDQWGPSVSRLYYNYYATQVMHHFEGEPWKKWNDRMRDQLVRSQRLTGHEAGSWYLPDPPNTDAGGRLYCTSLATMILEVYYRQMPLYGKQSAQEKF